MSKLFAGFLIRSEEPTTDSSIAAPGTCPVPTTVGWRQMQKLDEIVAAVTTGASE